MAQFGLALNRRCRSGAGDPHEETRFLEAVSWGKPAEAVAVHSPGRVGSVSFA
jgi:hypothetical protein